MPSLWHVARGETNGSVRPTGNCLTGAPAMATKAQTTTCNAQRATRNLQVTSKALAKLRNNTEQSVLVAFFLSHLHKANEPEMEDGPLQLQAVKNACTHREREWERERAGERE